MVRLECEFLMRGLDFLLVRQWVGKRMEGEMGGEGFYWPAWACENKTGLQQSMRDKRKSRTFAKRRVGSLHVQSVKPASYSKSHPNSQYLPTGPQYTRGILLYIDLTPPASLSISPMRIPQH